MNNIAWVAFIIILCGVLNFEGREGGTWYKDLPVARTGVTLCIMLAMFLLYGWNWWILSLGLVWAAMTIGDFGKFYWSPQGLACALAFSLYAYFTGHLVALAAQVVFLTLFTYLWSRSWFGGVKFLGTFGRGVAYCASCLLYLI